MSVRGCQSADASVRRNILHSAYMPRTLRHSCLKAAATIRLGYINDRTLDESFRQKGSAAAGRGEQSELGLTAHVTK
jgi:hypothetical protein